jgi:hypothetical protein
MPVMRAYSCHGGARSAPRFVCCHAAPGDWRQKSKPIKPGSSYPAKQNCSHCGLCDTYYIAHVKDACAFIGDGVVHESPCLQLSIMSRFPYNHPELIGTFNHFGTCGTHMERAVDQYDVAISKRLPGKMAHVTQV